jgi:hypothetical protein
LTPNNAVFDLSHFVELTELGRKWVDRIKEIEAEAAKAGQPTAVAAQGKP